MPLPALKSVMVWRIRLDTISTLDWQTDGEKMTKQYRALHAIDMLMYRFRTAAHRNFKLVKIYSLACVLGTSFSGKRGCSSGSHVRAGWMFESHPHCLTSMYTTFARTLLDKHHNTVRNCVEAAVALVAPCTYATISESAYDVRPHYRDGSI